MVRIGVGTCCANDDFVIAQHLFSPKYSVLFCRNDEITYGSVIRYVLSYYFVIELVNILVHELFTTITITFALMC